jgi:hypothetical protein
VRLVTNVAIPTITSGRTSLHFLPDRVLVREGTAFSDVPYSMLQTSDTVTKFIEGDPVPRDAQQVGTTWQYVNVKGGPDRRYKNNRQLPIMLYGELEFASPTGLRWVLDCSRPDVAQHFATVVRGAPAQTLARIESAA